MNLVRLGSAVLLLFLFANCGGPKKQIAGKWKTNDGTSEIVWEFFGNGTLSKDGADGRYTFGDNNRIKIQTQSATFIYQFEIQGETMTWSAPGGSKIKFTRAK